MVCPGWYRDRQILHLSYCLKSKINGVLFFIKKNKTKQKNKTKTHVTPQVKKKPLDPDHVQDTIRSFLGIQTHPLFSTCARSNASFLRIMSIQTGTTTTTNT